MAKQNINKEQKEQELWKVKELLLATIDYTIQNDLEGAFKDLDKKKVDVLKMFERGSLSKLNYWLRCFIEKPRETKDFEYVRYIKKTTGYDFDIFETFKKRIEKIIANNKITTESQYRDSMEMIENLIHEEPVDIAKIELLERLMDKF